MYQIDVPSAVGSLPTPAAAGTAGFFTDGNPGSGLPATIVPADFLNMVMQELINVVNQGGIPLSKTSYTQVRDAIANMIAAGGSGGGSGTVTAVTGVAPINSSGGVAPQISISAATESAAGSMSAADKTKLDGIAAGATANTGTVTAVTVASANGVSATVANQGTTPALTIALGAITPTSIGCSGAMSAASVTTPGLVTCGGLIVGGSFTGTARNVFQATNTDTSTSSAIGLSLAAGSAGSAVFTYYAPSYTGISAFAGAAVMECQGSGGVGLSAYGGGNINFFAGTSRTQVASISSAGQITCVTWNATGSDRRLKRNIRKFNPRPLHRLIRNPFVSYVVKQTGLGGLGAIAQSVRNVAPEHVGKFTQNGKEYLSLNYAGMAYEQSVWAGQEIDRLTAELRRLERKLEHASIQPRQRGLLRLLWEAIW